MTTLAQYGTACTLLAQATQVEQVLAIRDEIEHVRLYAKQIRDQALLTEAQVFQLKVERRLGEVIMAAKSVGHFSEGRPKKNGSNSEPFPGATLTEVGVDKKLSSRAQKLSALADDAFERLEQTIRERIASRHAEPINGARALMGSRQEAIDSLDYFPTPPWGTRALIEFVLPELGVRPHDLKFIWDPACGEGHMAEVLAEYCGKVLATDIHDYGYRRPMWEKIDFLGLPGNERVADWIITNPPFKAKAIAFVLRALELARVGVAMFLRLQWLEGVERYDRLFKPHPPTLIAPFVERVNLCKGRWDPDGTTATAYCWLVWMHGKQPQALFWIPPGCRARLSLDTDRAKFAAGVQ
jgi:methylase of polypeptide subunit release factors